MDARRATLLYADETLNGPLPERLREHLVRGVQAATAAGACNAAGSRPVEAARGYIAVELAYRCANGDTGLRLRIDALFRFAATHTHIVTLQLADGRRIERVLNPQRPELRVTEGGAFRSFSSFIGTGIVHVIGGPDHLAFIAALLLVVSGWRARVLTITAFTVGHSLTLVGVSLGRLDPATDAVEALIGFSILYAVLESPAGRRAGAGARWAVAMLLGAVAVCGTLLGSSPILLLAGCLLMLPITATGDAARRAPWLAAGFGLLHGAGFAGVLLAVGLPRDALWPALIGFNLGVEIGQLAVVAVLWLLADAVQRRAGRLQRPLAEGAPALLAGLGSYWFAARLLG